MADPFLGEIKLVAWSTVGRGWAFCNGALLPIATNQPLFSLLGTTYGGDGRATFGLPDLRGRVPLHGDGASGGFAGSARVALAIAETPTHTHQLYAVSNTGDIATVGAGQWMAASPACYGAKPADPTKATKMRPGTISSSGSDAPHENRQPYLALNYVIATAGIFPSRP